MATETHAVRRETAASTAAPATGKPATPGLLALAVLLAVLIAAPYVLYPVFVMKVLCFALFACAFNL
ncbi:branched-chain amino acid ABC transporter permease, partial [Azospirillum sp. C340-1]|nr:branched-chain amino acid ABC transporter permease [Azospirillum isscasi]